MTASPAAFLEFVAQSGSTLTPQERDALLAFADGLDPTISGEALTSRLSGFLLDHPAIDRRFDAQPQAQRGIGGQPIKFTSPEVFKTQLRNIVLHQSPAPRKDDDSTPKG